MIWPMFSARRTRRSGRLGRMTKNHPSNCVEKSRGARPDQYRGRPFRRTPPRVRSCPACRSRRARCCAAPARCPPSSMHAGQQLPVVQLNGEVAEPELDQDFAHGREHLDFDDRRPRSDGIDVALVELAEAAARRTVGAPDRLDLVALEELAAACRGARRRRAPAARSGRSAAPGPSRPTPRARRGGAP